MKPRHITVALATLALAFGSVAARAADEYVRVNPSQNASSSFVAGATAGNRSATASQLYWYNSTNNSYVSALGGNAALTVNNTALRAYAANSAATGPYEASVAKMTQGSANYATSYWSLDLGSNLLNSDVAGTSVVGSSINIVDFGNAGAQTTSYDFKIGLWDGSQLTQANSLAQLNLVSSSSTTGSVSYLGDNTFRFTETGGTGNTGTTLMITSAVSGEYVRSFSTVAFAHSGGTFAGDYVDLIATRTIATTVPEPASAGLLGLGLLMVFVARRRSSTR